MNHFHFVAVYAKTPFTVAGIVDNSNCNCYFFSL